MPRRVRGRLGGDWVVDTDGARYRWDNPAYPAFYLPEDSVAPWVLQHPAYTEHLHREASLPGYVRLDWDALDAWFEEDEEVFVHPRSPYVRVDALRSSRHLVVSRGGVVLAESTSPVLVFETGLPTRYYLDRTDVRLELLEPSETRTACPYKGRTSAYWSHRDADGHVSEDVAWCYDFPTRQLLPIAGLVAFFNERVDLTLDGVEAGLSQAPVPVRVTGTLPRVALE